MVVLKAFEVAGLAKGMRNYTKSEKAKATA
jgi:hypothetical protein